MMVGAHLAGVPPHEFFDYTYRMIAAVLVAEERRGRNAMGLALWAAYQHEHLNRHKRLPPLASLLRKLFPPRVMSPKALRRSIIGMAQAMGAQVVYRKKGS